MLDPRKPIREILRKRGDLFKPTNPQKGYKYARVFDGANRYEIYEAQALGYEIVKGNMPEDTDKRDAEGVARVGDTVLMRIKEDDYKAIREYKEALDRRTLGVASEEEERLYSMRAKGVKVFSFRDNEQLNRIVNKQEEI